MFPYQRPEKLAVTHNYPMFLIPDLLRKNTFRDLKSSGIDNLVLSAELLSELQGDWTKVKPLQEMAEEAGVSFLDAHAPFGNYNDLNLPDKRYRESMIRQKILTLHICRDFGIKTCTVHGGGYGDKTLPVERYMEYTASSLEQLLPEAEKCGVILALENLISPCNTPEKLIELLDHFRSPYLGLCYDSGHANLVEKWQDIEDSPVKKAWGEKLTPPRNDRILEKMLDYIVSCHLHDNDGSMDCHFPPGNGNVNWEKTCKLLGEAPHLLSLQNEASFVNKPTSMREMAELYRKLFPESN